MPIYRNSTFLLCYLASSHWNDPSMVSNIDAGHLSFIHVPNSVSLRSTATENIKFQDIPQVISLALGFSSLQNIQWDGLMSGNIFDHPKANVLFLIDGLTEGNVVLFHETSPTFTIVRNEDNSIADIFRLSPSKTFTTHMSNILNGKPLVISFSAQKLFAEAATASGKNSYAISWNAQKQLFQDDSNTFKLPKDEILKMFEFADFGKDVKYYQEERKFLVSLPQMDDTSFDMAEMEDFLFFAEIQALFYIYEKVKSFDSLIHDEFVDLFSVGISTLKGISQRYGNNSHQMLAALHVLNAVIPKVSKLFTDLYNNQTLVEVVGLGKLTSKVQSTVMDDAINAVLKDNSKSLRFKRDTSSLREAKSCKNDRNFAAIDDVYDENFTPIFNISLWLMIILVLTIYAVCIVIWYMDPGRDSIIYRVTSQRIKTE